MLPYAFAHATTQSTYMYCTTYTATVLVQVENVDVIHRLSIAFVRYRLRSNCEFAKEAMANQHLANTEVC
jgi:hypothetical protein